MAVWGFGGLGIWVEVIKHLKGEQNIDSILTAIYTYFPAVAFGSSMQLIIREDTRRHVRSFALLVGAILVAIAVLHGLAILKGYEFICGYVGIGIATILWWCANGTDENLHDNVKPNAPLGGAPEAPPAGTAGGYVV